VQLLVQRCISAPDGGPPTPALQETAVMALSRVVQNAEGLDKAIEVGAVPTTVNMLTHETREVRIPSGFCVAALCFGQDEKAVALKNGVMRKAVAMLHGGGEGDTEEQAAGAAVLMSMCNGTRFPDGDNACKSEAVKEGVVQALVPLLQQGLQLELAGEMNDATCALTVYSLKAMSSIADHPRARKALHSMCLDQLTALCESVEPLVRKNALIAVERITWEP